MVIAINIQIIQDAMSRTFFSKHAEDAVCHYRALARADADDGVMVEAEILASVPPLLPAAP
jgi:hypothetical protein